MCAYHPLAEAAPSSAKISGTTSSRRARTAPLLQALSAVVADPEWPRTPWSAPGDGSSAVLSVPDILRALVYHQPRKNQFSMAKNGRPVDPCAYQSVDGRLDSTRILGLLRRGASLHLYQAHEWIPCLGAVCAELSAYLQHEVRPVVFITPPHERGLGLHTDAHDVLVLQVHGRKRWRVHARMGNEVAERMNIPAEEAGALVLNKDLDVGDVLYVPRACPHVAASLDEISVHVSFVFRPPTLRDVLLGRVREYLAATDFDNQIPPRPMDHPDAVSEAMRGARQRLVSTLSADDMTWAPLVTGIAPASQPEWDWATFFACTAADAQNGPVR